MGPTLTWMLRWKLADAPISLNSKQMPGQELSRRYMRLVGKLNYLTVSRLDFPFVINSLMSDPQTSYWDVVIRVLSKRGLLYTLILGILE